MINDKYTIKEEQINVGDGHKLYAQLWGNSSAKKPIIFLHGGPGSGCSDGHKQLFDPANHQVLFFDQRGCGKSLPYGSLEANNTQALINDITLLADHFGFKKFTIVGGSWGSCLGLAYAIENPDRINALVHRGIFTGRQNEIDYVEKGEVKALFPDVWQDYLNRTPREFVDDPGAYHFYRVLGDDLEAMKASAYACSELESSMVSLDDRHQPKDFSTFDPLPTRIYVHYLKNGCFLPEGHILANTAKITAPIWLVQGRFDVLCPPITAYELHAKLPDSRLIWTQAGHSGGDRANVDAVKTILASHN